MAAGGFADGLEHRPAPGVGQQPFQEILAAEFADQIRSPPAQSAFIIPAGFACPGDDQLCREQLIDLRRRQRRLQQGACGRTGGTHRVRVPYRGAVVMTSYPGKHTFRAARPQSDGPITQPRSSCRRWLKIAEDGWHLPQSGFHCPRAFRFPATKMSIDFAEAFSAASLSRTSITTRISDGTTVAGSSPAEAAAARNARQTVRNSKR